MKKAASRQAAFYKSPDMLSYGQNKSFVHRKAWYGWTVKKEGTVWVEMEKQKDRL